MNKLISKIVGVALGLALATGTGVAIAANGGVSKAEADVTYTKVASYNFDSNNESTSKYDAAGLLARFNGCDETGTGLSDIVTSVSSTANTYAGYSGYLNYGLKFGTSSANGTFTLGTSVQVAKAVVVAAGWGTGDKLSISDSGSQTPGVAYTSANALKTLTFTFTPTSAPAFTFAKRGFIQSIEFYQAQTSGDVAVDGVSLDKANAYTRIGTNLSLTATVSPALATDKVVSWSSSNTSVATVSDGVVSPVSSGFTTITVTTHDGNFTAQCSVLILTATAGTVQSEPLTIAEAIGIAKTLANKATTADEFYISGEVTSIATAYSSTYGNISLNFSANSVTFVGYRLSVTQTYGEAIAAGDTVLMKGTITNFNGTYETSEGGSIITGTTYPEPTLVSGTLTQLFANNDGNYKQLYQVTGVVAAWSGTNTNATKYGNFYLTDIGGSTQYLIYGATATATALVWNENTGVYDFNNPQDFLTDTLTKDVVLTYKVTMKLTRCDHTSGGTTTPEACGIVTAVTPMPLISIDQEDTSLYLSGTSSTTLTATVENAPSATVVWTSSNTSVATVNSSSGLVEAASAGTTTVTATITVDNVDYSDSITVTVVAAATGPLTNGGRYYIIATYNDVEYGLSATASSSASPTAVALNAANNLIAFDFTLTGNNAYEITTTIEDTKYYLVTNSTSTSSNNDKVRVTSSPASNLASKSWELTALTGNDAGLYNVKENTTGSTYRYLSLYNGQDWRGYMNTNNGVPKIKFVEEGAYTSEIVSGINGLTCDSTGATAPSTTAWSNLANITFISSEIATLTNTTASQSGSAAAQAMAKYDYIVGKYLKGKGLTAYGDFLNRDPDIPSSANGRLNVLALDTSSALMIVAVTAFVTTTFVGGYFFLRKKKEN